MYRIVRYAYPYTARPFPALAVRHSWPDLGSEINHLFATALADFTSPEQAPGFPVDLTEDQDNFQVRAELPGVNREAIKIEVADGRLAIAVTSKKGEESDERVRSIALPEAAQTDKASAQLELGVLTITLPKREQTKPRQIDIH
jgi:HSP20 family protein